jgi:hypothetical protein
LVREVVPICVMYLLPAILEKKKWRGVGVYVGARVVVREGSGKRG